MFLYLNKINLQNTWSNNHVRGLWVKSSNRPRYTGCKHTITCIYNKGLAWVEVREYKQNCSVYTDFYLYTLLDKIKDKLETLKLATIRYYSHLRNYLLHRCSVCGGKQLDFFEISDDGYLVCNKCLKRQAVGFCAICGALTDTIIPDGRFIGVVVDGDEKYTAYLDPVTAEIFPQSIFEKSEDGELVEVDPFDVEI
jgi:hypothetical protein